MTDSPAATGSRPDDDSPAESAADSTTDGAPENITNGAAESTTNGVADSTTNSAADSTTNSAADSTTNSAADSTTNSAADATAALPRSVANVRDALGAHGLAASVARIRHIPDGARTAAEAAAALGVEVGAIANSLVFVADAAPLLVMTSGGHRVDTVALAARIGVGEIRRATPEIVRGATGQVIGGVAPVGHPAPLRTVVDPVLETFPELWAAAGHSHAVFPLTYAELVRITGGAVVPVD